MKKIDMRTKEGKALKAKQAAKAQANSAHTFGSVPPKREGQPYLYDPTIGGTGVAGAKYVPLDLDSDPVHAPNHYTQGGIETIDFIRAKLSPEMAQGYYLGNCLKYLSRAQFKGGAEDYKKAQVYLNWLVEANDKSA